MTTSSANPARTHSARGSEWLSLRDAAKLMGVHPATLRTWADRGRIGSRRTEGGHRRFKRADLLAWIEMHRSNDAGAQVLVQNALGRLRIEMERADTAWLAGYDEETRHAHRALGRRLLNELARESAEPVRFTAEDIGREYAALSRRRSLSRVEAVQAFLFFRDTIVDSLVQMASVLEPIAAPGWPAVHRRFSAFLNEVLLALLRAYEEKRANGVA